MDNNIEHNFTEQGLKYDYEKNNLYEIKRIRKFKNPNIFHPDQNAWGRKIGSDYFLWTDECNAFYSSPKNWDYYFPTAKSIEYKSTPIQSDENYFRLSKEKDQPTEEKDISIDDSDSRYPKGIYSETSGFIVPGYNFIDSIPAFLWENETSYVDTLDKFRIKENQKISAAKFTEIGHYRDLLQHQLERQAHAIGEINLEIASVFKIYLYELERAIVLTKMKASDNASIRRIQDDWNFYRKGFREFYKSIQYNFDPYVIDQSRSNQYHDLSNKTSDDTIWDNRINPNTKLQFHIEESTYIPTNILSKVLDGYYSLMMFKKPIIMMASVIISKIRPLESILEDHCRDMLLKTKVEYAQNEVKRGPHIHSPNSEWIKKTFEKQSTPDKSQNEAAGDTKELYYEKFGLKISRTQIYRICGIY